MGFLISLLAPRIGALPAKLLIYVGIPLLVLALVWWRVDAWGNRRFNAGVQATDAKWEEAGRRLQSQAAVAGNKADVASVARLKAHANQVETEEKGIAQAQQNGTSPLDVLFGG